MNTEQTIKGIKVTAKEWKADGQHRIYFTTSTGGNGCWDVNKKEWIKVKKQFASPFTGWVLEAFGLD